MCVIVIKKAGVLMPNEENIRDMWERNSDGAGFMYAVGGEVIIEKGFMTLRDFNNALAGAEKRLHSKGYIIKEVPFILHFRITTHGGTNAENTHPFPISKNIKTLQALDVITDLGMAHNGIIRNTPRSIKISDTMEFIISMVTPLRGLNSEFLNHKEIRELLKDSVNGSRLVFLTKDGDITKIGSWDNGTIEGTEELIYSNLHHEPYTHTNYTGTSYGNWSQYDDDEWYKRYQGDTKKKAKRNFKVIPMDVKPIAGEHNYALCKTEDIIGIEMLYPEGEQFDGKERPLESTMSIQEVDKNPKFNRYVDKHGATYYRSNYNVKVPLRVTSSIYWDMLIQISKDRKTYRIITSTTAVGDYVKAELVEFI